MLKDRPTNGQTYERIKNAIITPQLRNPPIIERMIVDATSTPLKNLDFACKSLLDLKHSEKENKILKHLEYYRGQDLLEKKPCKGIKRKTMDCWNKIGRF